MTSNDELPRWTYVGAYALCIDSDNRVLLCRVAAGYDTTGMWTLPGGGVEFGEDPRAAVVRELAEETGLRGEVSSLAFVSSHVGGPGEERGRAYGRYHAIRIVYRMDVTGGELADEGDGSTDHADWFTSTEAAALPLVELARAGLEHVA